MKLQGFIVLLILFFVYRLWFSFSGALSSGDWPYLYKEAIEEFSFLPQLDFLWLGAYYQIPTKILVEYLHIPWELTEKLLWFWPFLLIASFSSYKLTRSWLGVIIYLTNTYVLMVVGGGQMGIAMAYAFAPLVVWKFIDILDTHVKKTKIFQIVILGILSGILTMFDPRIAYIIAIAIFFYILFTKKFVKMLHALFITVPITLLINSFWIIPMLSGKMQIPLENFDSLAGFKYYSFTDFSHPFSLLHPNWPENLFGKVYFMQPEFIVVPLLAYCSLLFIKGESDTKKIKILFFAFLGILGAFLAKGSSEPLSQINIFLFSYLPGMSLFRDATKFYLLVAISYSVLIPYSIDNISEAISSRFKLSYIRHIVVIAFIIFWLFTIRQAMVGELKGTFASHRVPKEYLDFKEFINKKPHSKVLWIPSRQRYGFYSNKYPGESASELFSSNDVSELVSKVRISKEIKKIYDKGFDYVVVPYDSQREIFISDRKYSQALHDDLVEELFLVKWITQEASFGDIVVFKINN